MSLIARTEAGQRLAARSLEGFAGAADRADGLDLRRLRVLDQLAIETRNSRYRLTLLRPADGRALIEGGAFFPLPVEATIAGSTLGGSLLKTGCVLNGFRLEVHHAGTRVVTSRVRRIRLNDPSDLPGPF